MSIRLVKNATPKPIIKRKVKSIFRRAEKKAAEQAWEKVIVIGQGKDVGSWQFTNMSDDEAIGILERLKFHLMVEE